MATILSAQCTDARVNQVTPALFARYREADDYAQAPLAELEEAVRSTGFLTALPGVGRKTANVVLGNAFGRDEGIVVDTHVGRLSRRLGLSRALDPVGVERDLMSLVPRDRWTVWAHLLISHGRAVCTARRPRCGTCVLADLCPSAGRYG